MTKQEGSGAIAGDVPLNECIYQLKKNVGSIKLGYLLEYFREFIGCGQIFHFVELLVMVLETLDKKLPEIERELQSCLALEERGMQEESESKGSLQHTRRTVHEQ